MQVDLGLLYDRQVNMKYFLGLIFPLLSTITKAALCVTLLSTAGSCEALFGGLSAPNPANCESAKESCLADEVCHPQRQVCVPALALFRATPNLGSSRGGTTVTLFGERFLKGMTVELDGQTVSDITYKSSTEVSFTLPASTTGHFAAPITIRNPTGHTAQNDSLFRYYAEQLAWSNTAYGSRLSSSANTMLVEDYTDDGRADVLFGVAADTTLQVYPSAPDGQPLAPIVSSAAMNPDRPTVLFPFALPTDSQPGALLGWGNQVQRFSCDGRGNLTGHERVGVGATVSRMTVCKTDRSDARLVVTTDTTSKEIFAVALRLDGTFETPNRIAQGMGIEAITCKDLDGDGKDELLTSDGKDTLTIWNLSQPGGITQKQVTTTGVCVQVDLATADLDQDGDEDAVLSCTTGLLPLRNENGNLVARTLIPSLTTLAKGIIATDLSGDGWPDIVYADLGGRKLQAVQANRQGGYLSPVTVYADAELSWTGEQNVAVGDVNADGKLDVVYSARSSGTRFAVALNQSR